MSKEQKKCLNGTCYKSAPAIFNRAICSGTRRRDGSSPRRNVIVAARRDVVVLAEFGAKNPGSGVQRKLTDGVKDFPFRGKFSETTKNNYAIGNCSIVSHTKMTHAFTLKGRRRRLKRGRWAGLASRSTRAAPRRAISTWVSSVSSSLIEALRFMTCQRTNGFTESCFRIFQPPEGCR